jgi:hypothetical protein
MELTKKDILAWCIDQHNQGLSVTLEWDGGGDSGCVNWTGDSEENAYTDYILDMCYDELDYGSWAGEFSAHGTAEFDPEEKAFIGEDLYSEDEYVDHEINLEIPIPKNIQFDDFHFEIDCPHDEECNFSASITLANGFNLPTTNAYLANLEVELAEKVNENMTDYSQKTGDEYIRCYQTEVIPRHGFSENCDNLVYTLSEITYTVESTMSKNIFINLDVE